MSAARRGTGAAGPPIPAAIRQQALRRVASGEPVVSVAAALDVKAGTVRSWVSRAGSLAGLERIPITATPATPVPWETRVRRLGDAYLGLAAKAAGKVRDALDASKARDARDYSVAVGILTDKMALVGGLPTSRHESRSLVLTSSVTPESLAAQRAENDRLRAEVEALEAEARARGEVIE